VEEVEEEAVVVVVVAVVEVVEAGMELASPWPRAQDGLAAEAK